MHRTHDASAIGDAVATARAAGIGNLSLDLIFALPDALERDFERDVERLIALQPDHVSVYGLTVEPATPLGRAVSAGTRIAPDDDRQADAYARADDTLTAAGFEWYEISNWAKPGEACRHNLLYWNEGEYAGIGCAAHGHTAGRRWWNVRTPERYIAAVRANDSAEAGSETLDPETRAEEAFTHALRTSGGAAFAPSARSVVAELVDQGCCTVDDDRIILTRIGRLLASDITARLLLAGAGTR
jgi:oxygen-independent coproporphyrinogen-3 oxidase